MRNELRFLFYNEDNVLQHYSRSKVFAHTCGVHVRSSAAVIKINGGPTKYKGILKFIIIIIKFKVINSYHHPF